MATTTANKTASKSTTKAANMLIAVQLVGCFSACPRFASAANAAAAAKKPDEAPRKAAPKILREERCAGGVQARLLPHECCGRPLISQGRLDEARVGRRWGAGGVPPDSGRILLDGAAIDGPGISTRA